MPLFRRPSTRSIIARAVLIGIAAGLRSATPLGTLARYQPEAPRRAAWAHWPLLRSGFGRVLLQLGWLGELVADKLPFVPPRTQPGPLGGRMVMGAVAGLAVGSEAHGAGAKMGGAALGAAGAVVGSFGGNAYRSLAVKATGLPDLPVAVAEDVAAAALARTAVRG
jgi:uncharacterized membrane protein